MADAGRIDETDGTAVRQLSSSRQLRQSGVRRSVQSWLEEYGGLAPATVLLGVFFLVPLGLIVAYSFWRVVDYRVVADWTLDNYRYFLGTSTYLRTLWNTLWVTVVTTVLTVGLAFPFAYWLVRHVSPRLQRRLLVLVVLPLWTSYLLRIYAWQTILGEQGVFNRLLQWTGVIDGPVSFLLYNRPAVVLVMAYLYFPFAALALYAAFKRFDWSLVRAAADLGASPRRAFLNVLLPCVRTGVVTAVIFVSVPVLGEFLAPQLIGGTRGVMIGNLIANFFLGAEYTRGAAAALLIAAFVALLLVVFRRALQVGDTLLVADVGGRRQDVVTYRDRLARAWAHAYGLAVYVFLFAPIAIVVVFSFNASRAGTFPITGWTLRWYRDVFANVDIQAAFWMSLAIAAQVTVISTVVGTAAAFPLVRSRLPFRAGVRVLVTLPIMLPGLLIGVSLLVLFTDAWDVGLSQGTAVIGQALLTTPFVVLIVSAQLEGFDSALERAAHDLGAGTFRRLRYVVLPLVSPAIGAGALLAFTLAFDEFIVTLFVIGGQNTLPIYVFTQVKQGITPEVNALASLLLCAPLLLMAVAAACAAVIRRARRHRSFSNVRSRG